MQMGPHICSFSQPFLCSLRTVRTHQALVHKTQSHLPDKPSDTHTYWDRVTQTHTHKHTNTNTNTHTHTNANTNTNTHRHCHIDTNTNTDAHKKKHSLPLSLAHRHTHTNTQTNRCIRFPCRPCLKHTHRHRHCHTQTPTQRHPKHTLSRSLSRAHTHTQTHKPADVSDSPPLSCMSQTSRTWMSHGTHTYIMTHARMRHVIKPTNSCHTYECIVRHVCIIHSRCQRFAYGQINSLPDSIHSMHKYWRASPTDVPFQSW